MHYGMQGPCVWSTPISPSIGLRGRAAGSSWPWRCRRHPWTPEGCHIGWVGWEWGGEREREGETIFYQKKKKIERRKKKSHKMEQKVKTWSNIMDLAKRQSSVADVEQQSLAGLDPRAAPTSSPGTAGMVEEP